MRSTDPEQSQFWRQGSTAAWRQLQCSSHARRACIFHDGCEHRFCLMPAALPDAWLRFCLTLVPPNACGCCGHLLPRKPWRKPEVRWHNELLALLQAGRQRSPAAVDCQWPTVVAVVMTAAAGSTASLAHPAVQRRAAPAAPCHCPAKLPPLPVHAAGAGGARRR